MSKFAPGQEVEFQLVPKGRYRTTRITNVISAYHGDVPATIYRVAGTNGDVWAQEDQLRLKSGS